MLKEVDGGRRLIKMAGNVVWRRFADDEGDFSHSCRLAQVWVVWESAPGACGAVPVLLSVFLPPRPCA
jgi:hypothetical protein